MYFVVSLAQQCPFHISYTHGKWFLHIKCVLGHLQMAGCFRIKSHHS